MTIQKKSLSGSKGSKKAAKNAVRGSKDAVRGAKRVNLKVYKLPAVQ
jgi:hypothetical protein